MKGGSVSMSEIWDLYTKYRKLAGIDHERGNKIPEGLFHLVVHVWIRNSKGQYLVSQRLSLIHI